VFYTQDTLIKGFYWKLRLFISRISCRYYGYV